MGKHKHQNTSSIENSWAIAINRKSQPFYVNEEQVKEIIKNNIGQEILLWKNGMTDWKNALTFPEFMSTPPLYIQPPTLPKIVENIKNVQQNLKVSTDEHKLKNKI